jgi:uncharacterized protein YfaS (alpha-2-macroglobulin family)/TolA-binding protein
MTRPPALLALLLALLCLGPQPAAAQDSPPAALEAVPARVREAMMARQYEQALAAVDELAVERPGAADFWCWLRGLALVRGNRSGSGATELERFEVEFAGSPWRPKALFLRAEALRDLRRFEAAEALYERAVAELRSEPRQRELAAIYIDFADALSTPGDGSLPVEKLDYARAEVLYGRTLDLDLPRDLIEHARFRRALCKQRLSDWPAAVALYGTYLDEFDPRGEAQLGVGRVPEARQALGECQLASGDRRAARRTFEDLAARLRAAPAAGDGARRAALAQLAGDAEFQAAGTWLLEGGDDRLLGIAGLRRLLQNDPQHLRATQALFQIAETYRALGRQEDALAAFEVLGARPAGEEAEREESVRLRQRALFLKGQILFEQGRLDQAIGVFTTYTRTHPSGADWAAAQRQILEAEYARGEEQRAAKSWEAARATWTRFLEDHPLDPRAADLLLAIGELYHDEARSRSEAEVTPSSQTLGLYHEALREWRKLPAKYPGSAQASQALWRIGVTQETALHELEDAIETYRSCTFGPFEGQARSRLWQMTQEFLDLRTERVWRSDEPAVVLADLRNVEKLEVAIYPLDLEAYFRKHLTHRSIEDLDLDLIAPDRAYSFEIEDYERYAALERRIEIPVTGPGVWAIALSTEQRRATTLLIRSDIDVVIKSSQKEVFVFAEDMRAQAPAEGVRVLVALPSTSPDTPPTFHEARTDADGVARLELSQLERSARLRVFAAREGHCASDGLSLENLGLSRTEGERWLVYPSRPAFRPGDEVHWRALLREVRDGALRFRSGAHYTYELTDAHGRVIDDGQASLSEFGTLHGAVRLDPHAPTGTYAILVRDSEGREARAGFEVERYRLEPIELVFEFESEVYFRGEEVRATLSARYYYGEPVADSPIAYELPDGRRGELRTDAQGHAQLSFNTRDFAREGLLSVRATLTEERVSTSGGVLLALRGFQVAIDVERELFLAGDRFQVDVETRLPDGAPTGRALELRVLRLESLAGGRFAELLESVQPFETDVRTGKASLAAQLERGGQYSLRVEGLDRFGNPVVAERSVHISGDDDETRLRILSDTGVARVGETLALDLHNRAGQGLALLTLEGEKVLEYRLLRLEPGHNSVALKVSGDYDPNFVVAAAMMRGHEFFEAHADFVVERELSIVLTPEREVWSPGEEAVVRIAVSDALGAPVAAELALSVVDEALYETYTDLVPNLVDFFRPVRREWAALRTATSCGFRYRGVTREISAEVLAEDRRAAAEKAWQDRRELTLDALSYADKAGHNDDFFLGRGPATPGPRLAREEQTLNAVIGLGGGAGGQFGGRFGGKRKRAAGEPDAAGSPALDADLCFWTPAVVTDAQGRALVRFRVPERSTRWRMTCRGTDRGTSMGEARGTFRSRADFFVELLAPESLTEGDRLRPRARIHNLTGAEGQATLELHVQVAGRTKVQTLGATLAGGTFVEVEFEALAEAVVGAACELEVLVRAKLAGTEHVARDAAELPVLPFGLRQVAQRSGLLRAEERVSLDLQQTEGIRGRELELYVGPDPGRALIEAALDEVGLRPLFACGTLHADAASDLSGVCAVLRSLARTDAASAPRATELRERARSLVASLVATQGSDGGWGWSGVRSASHPESSCRALGALAEARDLEFVVPRDVLTQARAYLEKTFTGLAHSDDELKAMILEAESREGTADFSALNRLHRLRTGLSPAALAYTTRALVRVGQLPMAQEVAAVLEERARALDSARTWPVEKNLHWNRSELELRALALLAMMESASSAGWIEGAVEALWQEAPWYPARARGVVISALAEHVRFASSRDRFRVRISLGGALLETFEFSGGSKGRTLSVPIADDAPREVQLDLVLEGRGRPHFSARLSGYSTHFDRSQTREFRVTGAGYVAVAPTYAGQAIPTGFSITQGLRNETLWMNPVSQAPLGGLLRGYLRYAYDSALPPAEDPGDFLVLEVPLPAGTRVLEGSVTGRFVSYEQAGARLLVQIGQLRGVGELGFTLIGADVGSWRAAPAVLHSAYEPARFAVAEPQPLEVLPAGGVSSDAYRPTPDELFHLGRALYRAGEFDAARARLAALYAEFNAHMREAQLRETAEMLLFLSIRAGDSAGVVRFFEVLREKNPDLFVPLADVLAVGRAYRELGEFERALLIFKAVLEESFGKDLKVAGTLEEQGEVAGSLDTLERLWLEYPDSPATRATYLALADKRLTKAPGAHEDESLRAAGRDRAWLSLQGILGLQRFLAFYPEDPQAADAALNLVSAYLDLEDYERVSQLCAQMATVYDEPRTFDAFEYSRAVAQWYLGRDEGAQALLARIAESTWVDDKGVLRPSQNRELALYILAQIFHARREYGPASEYYERIADQFSDARQVLEGFRERRLSLSEVTNTRIGAVTRLELSHANVPEVEVLAYRVDLMTLYLREKNLSAVTQVNLAGISPTLRMKRSLRDDEGPEDLETELELALDQAGAYLVICRGGELHASGLVLVTDIDLVVREDPTSGRLRVTATDERGGAYLSGLDVRVVGSGSGTVVRGETDRRGLFVADGIGGVATVIARGQDGEYAFYRGRTPLGAPAQQERGNNLEPPAETQSYFKNVFLLNVQNIESRKKQLQQEIDQAREGVQVKSVK